MVHEIKTCFQKYEQTTKLFQLIFHFYIPFSNKGKRVHHTITYHCNTSMTWLFSKRLIYIILALFALKAANTTVHF